MIKIVFAYAPFTVCVIKCHRRYICTQNEWEEYCSTVQHSKGIVTHSRQIIIHHCTAFHDMATLRVYQDLDGQLSAPVNAPAPPQAGKFQFSKTYRQ